MADMNYWNELQQRRGAVAALEALREEVTSCYDGVGAFLLTELIDQHIEKHSK